MLVSFFSDNQKVHQQQKQGGNTWAIDWGYWIYIASFGRRSVRLDLSPIKEKISQKLKRSLSSQDSYIFKAS